MVSAHNDHTNIEGSNDISCGDTTEHLNTDHIVGTNFEIADHIEVIDSIGNADLITENDTIEGLGANEFNALQFRGQVSGDDSLPQEHY